MPWTPESHDQYENLVGRDVFDAQRKKLGTVENIIHPHPDQPRPAADHYLVVKASGLFDHGDYFVPESLVGEVAEDRVVLEVTKGSLKDRELTSLPADYPG